MVFSGTFFLLVFLPVFLALYYLTPDRYKNYTALVASILFYIWGAPGFFFILFLSLIADYFLVKQIPHAENPARKYLVAASVILNIGLLAYFKYFNFFIDNVNYFLNLSAGDTIWTDVALPIGISFITFHKLSYAIDVYKGVSRPVEKFSDYALYILLFPHSIAGPIVRYNEISAQLINRKEQMNDGYRLSGLLRFIIGLAKKVLISNTLGQVADQVFSSDVSGLSPGSAWVGILAYTFQIYFDFSGYTDMAIGLAGLMGFKFPENFNFPYLSQNITEFWRRWHMTLGTWMSDYLYKPLGGNRKGNSRTYINLCVVFFISGLWHGAAWNFIVWGVYHGFFLIADRLFLVKLLNRIGEIPSILITFLITMIGWVFFRSADISYAWSFLGKMFSFHSGSIIYLDNKFLTMLCFAVIFSFCNWNSYLNSFFENWYASNQKKRYLIPKVILASVLVVLSIAEVNSSDFNPFIYFRF